MGFLYFDESIHEGAGFIIGVFVYCDSDLSKVVAEALSSVGLLAGQDEFKSSGFDSTPERRHALRHLLRLEMQDTRLGVIVTSTGERSRLGNEALVGLKRLIDINLLGSGHLVYFDQGISFVNRLEEVAAFESATASWCQLEQDSRVVGGLQVADLAAHSLATMVLESMGSVSKLVKSGPYRGYQDEDLDVNIGFELWVTTRRCLFRRQTFSEELLEPDGTEPMTVDTADYAMHISPGCPPGVRSAVLSRLGKMYLGCFH